jgi:hypothetical protein
MSDDEGTVQIVLRETAAVLAPLASELAPARARATFKQLGIDLTAAQTSSIATPLAAIAADVRDMLQLSAELTEAIDADDTGAILAKTAGLIEKVVAVVGSIDDLTSAMGALGLPPATVNAIPERLFNLMVVRALDSLQGVNELLELLGLLERQRFNEGSTDPDDPPYALSSFHFDRLGSWLSSPATVLRDLYGWNDPAFTGTELLERLGALLAALGAPAFFDATAVPPRLDLVIVEVVPRTDLTPRGLGVGLRSDFNTGTIRFQQDDWSVELELGFTLPFTSSILIQPTGITLVPPAPAPTFAGSVMTRVIADRAGAASGYVLIGQPGASRLEVRRAQLELGGAFRWDGTQAHGSFEVAGDVSGGKLIVSFAEADGFIGKLLSGLDLESDFAFGLGYSSDHGLYFTGSSTLAIQLPLHLALGPLEVTALTLSVGIQGQSFPTAIAVDMKAELGPLQAVVQQIGMSVDFTLEDDRSGNAGPVDVALGFKPPTGAGLSIDTGIVKGGGFLSFDPAKGEYFGVAELAIAEMVTVKAIGLITTKMPDGSQGFSLLVIVSAEFSPIQLGFGFTLVGVGGLLGLNRSVRLDVLRDGVRTGAVNSVMFPTDVVANAPRIISDLRAIFPPQEGTFLIGLMAKIGWGTPTLVSLSLGIIVEIPPGNIAILGVLKVVLPDEDAALIQLQVNFVGTLDFEQELLAFDASLFDSRIVFVALEGDMAVRLKWGDNAGFLLSVGGFHPAFEPPPLSLPALRRVSVSILDYDWATIRVDSYFAVTSNTVQFGAHAYLFFGVDGVNVTGEIGFDVLFQFSPFHFIAQISGSLDLSVAGLDLLSIDLRFSLEGPSPYRAKGTGSVGLLFFSVDVEFDVTWGEPEDTALPPTQAMPIFVGEINKKENWTALPPPASNLLVSLRPLDPGLEILHPFGALRVSQRALPLNLTLDKIGNQKPDDVNNVDITRATSGPTDQPLTPVDELFAAAQFQDMSDAEKLSRPSYQELKGGVIIGTAGGPQSSRMSRRRVAYQVTIVDKEPVRPPLKTTAIGGLFDGFLAGAAVARSPLSFQVKSQLQPYPDKVAVGPEGYTVTSTHDNTPFDTESTFSSEAMAMEHMRRRVAEDPALEGSLHVLPDYEVNRA